MEVSLFTIDKMINIAVELGATTMLIKTGQIKPYLKKSEAYEIYGRKNIERWFEVGLLTPRKDGSHSAAWRLYRLEIEILVKSLELIKMF